MRTVWQLLEWLRPHRGKVLAATLASLLRAAATGLLALCAGPLLVSFQQNDAATESPDFLGLNADLELVDWLGLVIILLVTRTLSSVVLSLMTNRLQESVVATVRRMLHDKLLRLHPDAFIGQRAGALGIEITDEAHRVRALLLNGLTENLRHLTVALGLATTVATLDAGVATWGLLGLPVGALVVRAVSRRLREVDKLWWDAELDIGGRAAEHAGIHALLRTRHAEGAAKRLFDDAVERSANYRTRSMVLKAALQIIFDLIGAAILTFLLVTGNFEEPSRALSLFAALFLLLRPLRALLTSWAVLASGSVALDRIHDLMALPEAQVGGSAQLEDWNSLKLDDATFSYGSRRILDGVSLELRRGEVIALVGPSGCGKSTLLRILAGYLEPDTGQILLGQTPLHELNGKARAAAIGWLDQDPMLLSGSLLRNVALGSERPDRARAEEALAEAEAMSIVAQLGIDGELEERGRNLSAGQRQRVAIARTLYHEPSVLLLDEPTTALDVESAKGVIENIRKLARDDRLIVVATHRPTLIAAADRVVEVSPQGVIEREAS